MAKADDEAARGSRFSRHLAEWLEGMAFKLKARADDGDGVRAITARVQRQLAQGFKDCGEQSAGPAADPVGYGRCPLCGAAGRVRERRPNGNDTCVNGHVYPSASAVAGEPPSPVAAGQ